MFSCVKQLHNCREQQHHKFVFKRIPSTRKKRFHKADFCDLLINFSPFFLSPVCPSMGCWEEMNLIPSWGNWIPANPSVMRRFQMHKKCADHHPRSRIFIFLMSSRWIVNAFFTLRWAVRKSLSIALSHRKLYRMTHLPRDISSARLEFFYNLLWSTNVNWIAN